MKNKFPTWRQILLLGELKEPQKLENKIDKQPNIVKVVEIDRQNRAKLSMKDVEQHTDSTL